MTRNEKTLMFVAYMLLFTTAIAGYGTIYFSAQLHKAEICNKAFVLWFKHNQGVNINLDLLYKDAVKWVNDPQYQ